MALTNEHYSVDVSMHCCEHLSNMDLENWPYQRFINSDWVETLKNEQIGIIKEFGMAIIPCSIVIAKIEKKLYIIDGQHRHEMIKKLIGGPYREYMRKCHVALELYNCGNNWNLAKRIYNMINSRYQNNCTADKRDDLGTKLQSKDDIIIMRSKQVAGKIKEAFLMQAGSNRAPKFDPNVLSEEIQNCNIPEHFTADDICCKIKTLNETYGPTLKNDSSAQYARCISGFYLPYMNTCCKWVKSLSFY